MTKKPCNPTFTALLYLRCFYLHAVASWRLQITANSFQLLNLTAGRWIGRQPPYTRENGLPRQGARRTRSFKVCFSCFIQVQHFIASINIRLPHGLGTLCAYHFAQLPFTFLRQLLTATGFTDALIIVPRSIRYSLRE